MRVEWTPAIEDWYRTHELDGQLKINFVATHEQNTDAAQTKGS